MCRSGCSMIEANEWQPGLPRELARPGAASDVVGASRAVVRRPAGMHLVRRARAPRSRRAALDAPRQIGRRSAEASRRGPAAPRPGPSPSRPGSGRAAPRLVVLAEDPDPGRSPARASLTCASRKPRFSSTTTISSSPARTRGSPRRRGDRSGPTRRIRTPSRRSASSSSPRSSERLAEVGVRLARRDQAQAVAGAADPRRIRLFARAYASTARWRS